MEEVRHTSNPVRLLILGIQIRDSLEAALKAEPENVQVRLDLLRFYMNAPGLMGGDHGNARAEAAEIAKRDVALGSFARGYIAYRLKEYGAARHELREAVRTTRDPATKSLALHWLGWLSQETQQYDEAFAVFDELRATDASGLYEIGRTAVFCTCQLDRGRAALESYASLGSKRTAEMPSLAEARYQLALVQEKLGNLDAARREIDIAWRLDPKIEGIKQTRQRIKSASAGRRRAP